jgi:ribonuclease P protein component
MREPGPMGTLNRKNTFPSFERIKSRKLFDLLYTKGKSWQRHPFRMVWSEIPYRENAPLMVAVAVPKRRMPHAVDRNRMKRLIREAYRLNRQDLADLLVNEEKGLAILFIFQSEAPLSFAETQEKIILLLQRLIQLYGPPAE